MYFVKIELLIEKPLLVHVHDIVMLTVMYVHVAIKNKLCDQVKI